jgi:hypothetical protein
LTGVDEFDQREHEPDAMVWQVTAQSVGIVLKDGRRIRCAALGAGRGERSARLDPYVRTLNDLFSTARQNAG